MIDLARHDCLQGALREAFDTFAELECLIEADRDRERERLRYADVRARMLPLARALQAQGCRRAAILMTNQSKWHVSACAVFWIGAVLVPLDPKLSAAEHTELLRHSGADTLFVEHHLLRGVEFEGTVVVTEAPLALEAGAARRWEDFVQVGEPEFVARRREDDACVVYSSGTGGRPKGCRLTHGNYLAQCGALTRRHAFAPGHRYLSILPTNHAIDFMVGFLGPYFCGAAVVHLRTLRPEFVRDAFPRFGITHMALVPLLLRNLQEGLRARVASLPPLRRRLLGALVGLNRALTRRRARPRLSRLLLRPLHAGFGGRLETLFVGGAFTDPGLLRFFYERGILVANGYGLTEAGTAVTLGDFAPYRPETVGRPLPGTDVRILEPDADGYGEVAVRSATVMAGYLDDAALTAETIVDGWLRTGDVGRLGPEGHLTLRGRRKNMIVTAGGKNVYPEDIENVFDGLPVKEYCIFAEHTLWPDAGERLLLVVRPEAEFETELRARNRRLPDFKRVHGYLAVTEEFPRTASLKIKRGLLADALRSADPEGIVRL